MDIYLKVSVERVDGRNLSAAQAGEHICAQLIRPGELPAEPGNIWITAAFQGLAPEGSHYRINSAEVVDTPPAGVRRRGTERRVTAIIDLADPELHS